MAKWPLEVGIMDEAKFEQAQSACVVSYIDWKAEI